MNKRPVSWEPTALLDLFPDAKHTIWQQEHLPHSFSYVSPYPISVSLCLPFPSTPSSSSPTPSPSHRETGDKASVSILGGKEEGEEHLRWKEQARQMHRSRDVLSMLSPEQEGYARGGSGADGGRAGVGGQKESL